VSDARREELEENLGKIKARVATAATQAGRKIDDITLVVVTKTFPVSDAQLLYELGESNFGENRNEEGSAKKELAGSDVTWHFQGQIQSKKIRQIVQWANVVHSLDSVDHARKFAENPNAERLKFFVQINLEPSRVDRGGVSVAGLPEFLEEVAGLQGIDVIGLMTVAPLGIDPKDAFKEVAEAKNLVQKNYPSITQLSMGMSGDFEEAIACGATHIRIGSSILGSRPPQA
jgi:pyridoxal phosphate enzyme (YggS family)